MAEPMNSKDTNPTTIDTANAIGDRANAGAIATSSASSKKPSVLKVCQLGRQSVHGA